MWLVTTLKRNMYTSLGDYKTEEMYRHGFLYTIEGRCTHELWQRQNIQYIPRNMHTFFALLCFVVVIHWLIFPNPSGLLHWHCGNITIAPVPAKQPWWIWINTSCEFIMNDCIITTKQSTTKPCAYFLGYPVFWQRVSNNARDPLVRKTARKPRTFYRDCILNQW